MRASRYFAILLFLVLASMPLGQGRFGLIASAIAQTAMDTLAAQVRTQGVKCDKPQQAVRDAKRSRPDYDVWVLTCENATYRVSRYPDLAAKIVRLR